MKRNNIVLSGIIILLAVIVTVGCKKKEEEPEEGDLKITCVPMTGETVDVSNLTVELHKKATFELPYKSSTASGSATSSSVTFSAIPNGKYYIVAWEDLDSSDDYSSGDTFGFFDAPVRVDGKNISKTIEMYEAP